AADVDPDPPNHRLSMLAERRAEVEIVAECARPDMFEAFWRQEYRRRWERDDRHASAIADRLGSESFAGHRVEHTNQIRGHRGRCAVAPRHDPLVLERDLQARSAIFVETFDRCLSAQKPFGRAARNIDDLAAENELALGFVEDCGDRIFVAALRLAHP